MKKNIKIKTISFLAVIIIAYVVIPLSLGKNLYVMSLITSSLIIGGLALSWSLLGNLGGMISFGQVAFFGVGAYISALLTLRLGWTVFPSMLIAALGAMVASLTMLPALRLRGPYFALSILAYSQIFRILAIELQSLTGGAAGLAGIPIFPTVLGFNFGSKIGGYILILTIVVFFTVIYAFIRRSNYGLALRAIENTEEATRVVGVNSTLLKASMLIASAFMAGLVGAFNAHYMNFLEPDYAFDQSWVILPIIASIFGGYRTIIGPLIGAVVIYMLDQLIFKNIMPIGHQLVLGGLLVLMIIASPEGLVPLVSKRLKGKKHVRTA